jgi:hypothetical protein
MLVFLFVRNRDLQNKKKTGQISDIKAKDFLPFSNGINIPNIIGTLPKEPEINSPENNAIQEEKLTQIGKQVAGQIFIKRNDEIKGEIGEDKNGKKIYEQIDAVRYVLKENGFVYDYLPKYKKSYLISNTEIPQTSIAIFSPDGTHIIFRSLDKDMYTEKSVKGILGKNTEILPNNITSFDFNTENSLVYVKPTNSGGSQIIENKGGKNTVLYESPIQEWNVMYSGENIILTTKASELAPGYSYILNKVNKSLSRIIRAESGLTTLASNNGEFILYSETKKDGPVISILNTKTNAINSLGKLGMSDKCIFNNTDTYIYCALPKSFENTLYPDSWYTGEIVTNDALVAYTTTNLNEKIILNMNELSSKTFDIESLSVSESGKDFAFINKTDNSLWIYEE